MGKTKNLGVFFYQTKTRTNFAEEKHCFFGLILLKITHPDQDNIKMRLIKSEANETRPGLKIFHQRLDNV